MNLPISGGAELIISTLEKNGYSANIVGGAVRDLLMNKIPHDFDIASSAPPEAVKRIFKRTIDTGIKHGTVTVIENNIGYEVTSYRIEGAYRDGRRPSAVSFTDSLEDDLARRDFTINAMAYNPEGGITDIFGGSQDIENKLIRCVGEPEKRFGEDALRMLRALRFSVVLGFDIEEKTAAAIKKCSPLIKKISFERIRDEINKILMSDCPEGIARLREYGLLHYIIPELERCIGERQKNKYHIYDVFDHIIHTVEHTPTDLTLRWAALLHDVGKPCCASCDASGIIHFYGHHRESVRLANDILHRMRMDSDAMRDILILIENHDVRIENSQPGVKRMMTRTGAALFEKLLILQEADNMAKNMKYFREKKHRLEEIEETYKKILAEHQPYQISDLAVNGRDLIKTGYRPGRALGDCLKRLLEEVIINPELNRREYLIMRAKELKSRKG